ncbi:hypothetical protein pipiens_018543, partial [Culex pipiens pipiens]
MSNPPSPNPLLKAELPPDIKLHVIGCDHGNAFLERVRKFLEGYDASKLGQAQLRLEKMDETYNVFVSHIQALELVNDSLDPLLQFDLEKEMGDFEDNFYELKAKLQAIYTKREWEREGELKKVPTYTQLVDFLKKRISQLQSAEIDSIPRNSKPSSRAVHTTTSSARCSCVVCGGNHQLFYCDKFRSFTVAERAGIVARNKLCINCMADKHSLESCKQRSCKFCGRRHNTLLHRNVPDQAKKQFNSAARREVPSAQTSRPDQQSSTSGQDAQVLPSTSTSSVQTLVTSRSNRSPTRQVFLSTALVKVVGPKGKTAVARVLLDNASQPNLMTERFRRILNLRKTPVSTELYGVGAERKSVAYSVVATVCSRFNNYRSVLEFLVLQKVTTNLPTTSVETDDWDIPSH